MASERKIESDLPSVDITEAKRLVEIFINLKRPVFLHGPVGVGKSELVSQIGKEQKRPVIDLRMSQMDISDLRGIPFLNTKTSKMEWAPPVCLPTDPKDNSILFLDEINCASPSIQASAYQLILDRRIGEYVLPAGVAVVAAGNRDKDRGATFKIATPLLNRFVHLDIRYDHKAWLLWAKKDNNIHPAVVRFLAENEKEFTTFDPKSNSRAFATPRSWKYASDCLSMMMKDDSEEKSVRDLSYVISACVGEAVALKFCQWYKTNADLDLDAVLEGTITDFPASMGEKQRLSRIHSVADSLAQRLSLMNKNGKGTMSKMETLYKSLDNAFAFIDKGSKGDRELLYTFVSLVSKKYNIAINQERAPRVAAFINSSEIEEFLKKAALEKNDDYAEQG